ncbi:MAG: YidC/Oxa1 family membrane protein insertase [Dehalococcoidia bacterium]|nr:YidC/Oxa1 family membrane protein insertase [Dehalococcoidia bacterium]
MLEFLGSVWNEGIIRPMVNSLVALYMGLFQNFGLSIIVFTVIISVITLPLTLKSIRQTQAMTAMNPRLQEMKRRYAGDRQRMGQEQMRLFKEYGISPLGCLGPLVVQMPVLYGLYLAIIKTLPSTPERLVELSGLLYSWLPGVSAALPLNSRFLGMDLGVFGGAQGVVGYVLVVLVGVSMWISTKLTTPPAADATGQQTQMMMQWIMPAMVGFFSLSFPVGLSVYWVASNLFRILLQGAVAGPRSLIFWKSTQASLAVAVAPAPVKEIADNGIPGDGSKDRRRGDRVRSQGARRRSGRGRDRGR